MPLLDHFRPPYDDLLPWESVGFLWVGELVGWLNRTLPRDDFRAFANVHLGPRAAADVAEYTSESGGGISTLTAPPPAATLPAIFPDEIEVQISETRRSLRLSGVVEFVSPANKKEADERQAFLAKCVTYLRQGVGLVVVDPVTERRVNFHNDLVDLLGIASAPRLPAGLPTYVSAYRAVHRPQSNDIDLWVEACEVGRAIPSVPLGLRKGPVVPLPLEDTYLAALRNSGHES